MRRAGFGREKLNYRKPFCYDAVALAGRSRGPRWNPAPMKIGVIRLQALGAAPALRPSKWPVSVTIANEG